MEPVMGDGGVLSLGLEMGGDVFGSAQRGGTRNGGGDVLASFSVAQNLLKNG